jgi:hypothetical protein
MWAVCAQRLMAFIEMNKPCPFCEESPFGDDWTENFQTEIIRQPPDDRYWIDRIEFTRRVCLESMALTLATAHQASCSIEPKRRQPDNINL